MSPEQYELLLELTELFEKGEAQRSHLIQLKGLLSKVNQNDAFSNQTCIPKAL